MSWAHTASNPGLLTHPNKALDLGESLDAQIPLLAIGSPTLSFPSPSASWVLSTPPLPIQSGPQKWPFLVWLALQGW